MEKVVHKYKLGEEPENDLEYWLTKTPQEKLCALEEIRNLYIKINYPGVTNKVERVITKRKLNE